MREQFLLDPAIIFLNHGSFGATPRPVLQSQQAWQHRMESEPVLFLGREIYTHLASARAQLCAYLNSPVEDIVFLPNATHGVNIVVRSLDLNPGDIILTTDHEYGACYRALQYVCEHTGAEMHPIPFPLPPPDTGQWLDDFLNQITSRTRLIFISHITSPTAIKLPIAELCGLARQTGVLTLVDGAHAPGQINLDLQAIGADFYTGNCHKWMLAPKGSGFLYARPEAQPLLKPLVVSWGWNPDPGFGSGNSFLDHFEWAGTYDPSAYLAVPDAIDFQSAIDWGQIRVQCNQLLDTALERIRVLTQLPTLVPPDQGWYLQMGVAHLPAGIEPNALQSLLFRRFQIEVPCLWWKGIPLIRVSIQVYNSPDDVDQLITALKICFSDL